MAYYTYLSLKIPGSTKAKVIKIHKLTRQSSRLWSINCDDGDVGATLHFALSGKNDSANTAEGTVLHDLIGKIKIYWMGGRAGLQWRVIAQQTAVNVDDDWLSGYSFFIRRRGYSNSYWYHDGKGTRLSNDKRTRFVVSITGAQVMAAKIPLIASDRIVISTIGPGGELQPIKFRKSGSGTDQSTFSFGDFLTSFNVDGGDNNRIVISEPGRGDSFELCEGIPCYF
ncbi:hypothetical protein IFM61392_02210 [Aspergillus lentulus]|uniref:Uncharacterized protein n=1 Tax=Aspergillus lentulus TaxID=293939 RepID=A0ABQ0ZV92_ASPLE|nr:hypothetical protein IFM62136_01517 [Aspergillus lentulus]GFF65908.1 hypothetical protein IFM60648_01739 [Aspergillus lentulus]GFF71155.1 hypothetical protein IFM47457_02816 [Aspergillus lentulus]GFG02282.1 hypothetical protein IFM61392_02210 [Aspergillus lentulus]